MISDKIAYTPYLQDAPLVTMIDLTLRYREDYASGAFQSSTLYSNSSYLLSVKNLSKDRYFVSPIPLTFFNSLTERNPFLFSL
jgi:hypothetical protein